MPFPYYKRKGQKREHRRAKKLPMLALKKNDLYNKLCKKERENLK